MLFARYRKLIPISALAVASVAAQAVPVTYQLSTSNIGTAVFSADFSSAKEQGEAEFTVGQPASGRVNTLA